MENINYLQSRFKCDRGAKGRNVMFRSVSNECTGIDFMHYDDNRIQVPESLRRA